MISKRDGAVAVCATTARALSASARRTSGFFNGGLGWDGDGGSHNIGRPASLRLCSLTAPMQEYRQGNRSLVQRSHAKSIVPTTDHTVFRSAGPWLNTSTSP